MKTRCKECDGTGTPKENDHGLVFTCACGKCGLCHGTGMVDEEALLKATQELIKAIKSYDEG